MYQQNPFKNKISSEFACRLKNLAPQQKVSVIVFLDVEQAGRRNNSRLSRAERRVAMEAIRHSAKLALDYIRKIIQDFGGKELADPDVLGSVPIEISAAGVKALAASDAVKAVVEEQKIHPNHEFNSVYVSEPIQSVIEEPKIHPDNLYNSVYSRTYDF